MNCYLCDEPAKALETTRDAKSAECRSCGIYMVSGSLLAERAASQLTFDLKRTREWLSEQRRLGISVPLLATTNVYWSERPWPSA